MIKYLSDKKIQKYIYIAMTALIVPGFLLFGVVFVADKNRNPSSTLGVIDNTKITVQDYLKSYRAIDHQIMMRFGDQAAKARAQLNLKGEAWDRLLLSHYAKKQNIRVSDSEVVQWLMSQPAFFTQNRFDENLYKLYIRNYIKSEPRAFEEEIRQALTIDKVRDRLTKTISASEEELRRAYDAAHPTLDIAYGVLPYEGEKAGLEVKESEITPVYNILKDKLTAPASKEGEPAKKLSPEEGKEEVKKIILKQKATEAAMKKLSDAKSAMAQDGSDFEKVLADKGIQTTHIERLEPGGTLPMVGSTQAIERGVATLKEGEVSAPISVQDGAALAKLIKKLPATDALFEKNKDSFRNEFLAGKMDEEMKKLLEKLRNDLKLNLELMKKIFPEDEETE